MLRKFQLHLVGPNGLLGKQGLAQKHVGEGKKLEPSNGSAGVKLIFAKGKAIKQNQLMRAATPTLVQVSKVNS